MNTNADLSLWKTKECARLLSPKYLDKCVCVCVCVCSFIKQASSGMKPGLL